MNLILACDKNYGIGINNALPKWNIKGDLTSFSHLTIGKGNNVVIMGKNTYISLPNNYLKNRLNIVVSKVLYNKYKYESINEESKNDINYTKHDYAKYNNTFFFTDMEQAYNYAVHYISTTYSSDSSNIGEIWVIGGSAIYEAAIEMNIVDKIYLTHVKKDYNCDTFLGDKTIKYIKKNKKILREKYLCDENDNHENSIYYSEDNTIHLRTFKFAQKC